MTLGFEPADGGPCPKGCGGRLIKISTTARDDKGNPVSITRCPNAWIYRGSFEGFKVNPNPCSYRGEMEVIG